MSLEKLVLQIDGSIATIKINRPEVLNAVDVETILELETTMHSLNDDKKVKVIIITGEGKSFVAGSDISKLAKMDSIQAREYSQIGQRVLNYIENIEKPVIAAINGYALGSGCEIAMACDIRIASEKAKLGQPESKLGLIPGHGGTQRLARLVGIAKAKELIFTSEIIDAQEALKIGLVNKVVPAEELITEVQKIAQTISQMGPMAIKLGKTVINRGLDSNFTTGTAYESEAFSICFSTPESKEGINAFLEKRKPDWETK
jgi:enoyl-CoA hydratase